MGDLRDDQKQTPNPGPSVAHVFDCQHGDACRCDLRDDLAAAIAAAHGCSCETHDTNGVVAACDAWRRRAGERAADVVLAVLAGREAAAVAAVARARAEHPLTVHACHNEPDSHWGRKAGPCRTRRALDGAGDGMPNISGTAAGDDKSGMDGAGDEPRLDRRTCDGCESGICAQAGCVVAMVAPPAEPAGDEPRPTWRDLLTEEEYDAQVTVARNLGLDLSAPDPADAEPTGDEPRPCYVALDGATIHRGGCGQGPCAPFAREHLGTWAPAEPAGDEPPTDCPERSR